MDDANKAQEQPVNNQSKAKQSWLKENWWVILSAVCTIAIIILMVLTYKGYFNKDDNTITEINDITGPMKIYSPASNMLENNWTMTSASTMNKFSLELVKQLKTEGVTDAALWEFKRGNESAFVWVREYSTLELRKQWDNQFTSIFKWHNVTWLLFGNPGMIGIYSPSKTTNPPLMLYAADQNMMIYISYYNSENSAYVASENPYADKRWMIDLATDILESTGHYSKQETIATPLDNLTTIETNSSNSTNTSKN